MSQKSLKLFLPALLAIVVFCILFGAPVCKTLMASLAALLYSGAKNVIEFIVIYVLTYIALVLLKYVLYIICFFVVHDVPSIDTPWRLYLVLALIITIFIKVKSMVTIDDFVNYDKYIEISCVALPAIIGVIVGIIAYFIIQNKDDEKSEIVESGEEK